MCKRTSVNISRQKEKVVKKEEVVVEVVVVMVVEECAVWPVSTLGRIAWYNERQPKVQHCLPLPHHAFPAPISTALYPAAALVPYPFRLR